MKNYGWQKAIDAVNAKIKDGVTSEKESDVPMTPEKIATGDAEPDRREAIIFNACRSLGMPELAPLFAGDTRSLPEIMRGIYASKMQIQVSKIARGQGFGNWVR